MKLLGWMHRKLRQTGIKPFKDITIGNSCACFSVHPLLHDQQCHTKTSCNHADLKKTKGEYQKSSSELETKKAEEVFGEESSSIFDGFLTIGTLGTEINGKPSTQTFPMPFDDITEKETEVKEKELKLINDELEKLLDAEAKEVYNLSSEHSSHVSTIALSGKQIEGVDTEEYGDMAIFPLQEYLFGFSIELSETSVEVKKEKTTLGQLFKRNNNAYKHTTKKYEKGENQAKGKYAIHFMKKILKKLHFSSSNSIASAGGDVADSISNKRKLTQVLRLFHKKIHPEIPTSEGDFTTSHKYKIHNTCYGGDYGNGDPKLQGTDDGLFLNRTRLKKEITSLNITHNGLSSNGSTEDREHWIKTDSDYLVLEL